MQANTLWWLDERPLIYDISIFIVCCFVIWPHWVVVVIPLFSVSYHSSAFATKLGEGWRQNWKYRFGWNCQFSNFQNAHGITKSLEQNITGLTSTLSMCGKCLRQDKVCFIWKKEIMFGTFWTNPPRKHFRLLTFQLFPSWLNLKYRGWKIWALMDTSERVRNCPDIQYQTLFSDFLSVLSSFCLFCCCCLFCPNSKIVSHKVRYRAAIPLSTRVSRDFLAELGGTLLQCPVRYIDMNY